MSIAAFERTSLFAPFSSKYDYYPAGKDVLTDICFYRLKTESFNQTMKMLLME